MNKNYIKLVVFICIVVLGFTIAILWLSWPSLTGKTYILDVPRPVDPFDILRGQYMTIGYEVNRLVNITGVSEQDIGKTIFVKLKEDNLGISRPDGIYFDKPETGDFIKGEIKSVHENSVNVEYGIENYFFERDAFIDTRNMTVEVKIGSSGQARISKLLQNGEPLVIKYRENSLIG